MVAAAWAHQSDGLLIFRWVPTGLLFQFSLAIVDIVTIVYDLPWLVRLLHRWQLLPATSLTSRIQDFWALRCKIPLLISWSSFLFSCCCVALWCILRLKGHYGPAFIESLTWSYKWGDQFTVQALCCSKLAEQLSLHLESSTEVWQPTKKARKDKRGSTKLKS